MSDAISLVVLFDRPKSSLLDSDESYVMMKRKHPHDDEYEEYRRTHSNFLDPPLVLYQIYKWQQPPVVLNNPNQPQYPIASPCLPEWRFWILMPLLECLLMTMDTAFGNSRGSRNITNGLPTGLGQRGRYSLTSLTYSDHRILDFGCEDTIRALAVFIAGLFLD